MIALAALAGFCVGFTFAAWLFLTAQDHPDSPESAAAHGASGRGALRGVGGNGSRGSRHRRCRSSAPLAWREPPGTSPT